MCRGPDTRIAEENICLVIYYPQENICLVTCLEKVVIHKKAHMARACWDLMTSFVWEDPLTSLLYTADMALSYTVYLVAAVVTLAAPVFFLFSVNGAAQYSVHLAAFQGLNNAATAGHTTVAPAFNITVRGRNPNTYHAWCHDHGEVVVSYSGVALASGRVPGFCVPRRSAANFTVVALPLGKGVRLSHDLRGRLASEWRAGAAKVLLEMELHYYPNDVFIPVQRRPGTLSISQELMLGDAREVQINVL